jgi:tetratricopeptide (TPR) repeat protein
VKKVIFAAAGVFLSMAAGAWAAADDYRDTLPDWLYPLREAVYEQELNADEIFPLYKAAFEQADALSGIDRLNMRSRCDYLMGRAYQYYKIKDKAIEHYERACADAKAALDEQKTALGWTNYAESLSQQCALKSVWWVMLNGTDVEKFARNALELNPKEVKAQYLIASRWVYAPAPFSDIEKGIKMMRDILEGAGELEKMEKDDLFNVWTALAYGYTRDKKTAQALDCIERALSVYPSNKFVGIELKLHALKGGELNLKETNRPSLTKGKAESASGTVGIELKAELSK